MILLAALLGVVAPSTEASACYVAEQLRVLPLGVVDGELWALELEQHRESETESAASIHWTVEPRLVAFAATGRTLLERHATLRASDEFLDRRVASLYHRALADVRARGAEGLEVVRDVDCQHLIQCDGISFDPEHGRLVLEDGSTRSLDRPPQIDPELWSGARWGVGVTRMYASGRRRWLVTSLGTGSDLDPCAHLNDPACVDDRAPIVRKAPALDSAYARIEPLHHGHHVDLLLEL